MPSNIWLFDINRLSPTTSSADLSSYDGVYFGGSSTTESSHVIDNDSDNNNDGSSDVNQHHEQWPICPASMKSQRTCNPIREIVDPIVASSKNSPRDDGKEHISLAVSTLTYLHRYLLLPFNRVFLHDSLQTIGAVDACLLPHDLFNC